jgi:hypothetical protein
MPNSVHPTNVGRMTVQFTRAGIEQTVFAYIWTPAGGFLRPVCSISTSRSSAAQPHDPAGFLHVIPDADLALPGPDGRGRTVMTIAAHDATANVVDVSAPLPIRFAPGRSRGRCITWRSSHPARNQRYLFWTAQVAVPGAPGSSHLTRSTAVVVTQRQP